MFLIVILLIISSTKDKNIIFEIHLISSVFILSKSFALFELRKTLEIVPKRFCSFVTIRETFGTRPYGMKSPNYLEIYH